LLALNVVVVVGLPCGKRAAAGSGRRRGCLYCSLFVVAAVINFTEVAGRLIGCVSGVPFRQIGAFLCYYITAHDEVSCT